MRGEFIIFVTIFMVLYLFLLLVVLIPQFGMNMVPYLVMFTFLGAAIILSLIFAYNQEALDDVGWESVLVFALLMAALLVVIFVLWFFLKRKAGHHGHHGHQEGSHMKGHFHGLMHGHDHEHDHEHHEHHDPGYAPGYAPAYDPGYVQEPPCDGEADMSRVEVHEKNHVDYVSHGDHVHTRRRSQVHADVHSEQGHLHLDFEGDPGYLADASSSAHGSSASSAGSQGSRGRNRGAVYHFFE